MKNGHPWINVSINSYCGLFKHGVQQIPQPIMGRSFILRIEHLRQLSACVVIFVVIVDLGESVSEMSYTGAESFSSNRVAMTKRDKYN